ncbi:MAG TPA: FAD-dependent oxidoreductase [Acidimicrobiales bacterium]|nr:FAD-dependent oxidoreductase [Acidimicrobiales bacterium]
MRLVVIGGGPAGIQAAQTAARLGAEVVVIERDVIGGAANQWDCVPSKAMIATGALVSRARRAEALGLEPLSPVVDLGALGARVREIEHKLAGSMTEQLESQGVRIIRGSGHLLGPHLVEADPSSGTGPEQLDADAVLLSTGSYPRVPDWAEVDGERVLTTRQAYPPPEIPERLVVIGSGVTGVEFVHMFRSLGSEVTLIVSRQQVLPQKDPEVAAALEADFLERGVRLMKGARAVGIERDEKSVAVRCDDGREADGSHVLLCIGSVPASGGLGLEAAGVVTSPSGHVPVNHHCQSNVPHIYAAGDLSGRLPLASVAASQGHKVAEHVMGLHTREHRHLDYDKAASAIFTEPEIADVGLAEAEAFALGRKIRVTKVPYAANSRALIDGDARGFVKLVSDPATGIVLGGSIVGANAAELVSVIALAVTANLRVIDLAESLFVHPALAEALAEAAE